MKKLLILITLIALLSSLKTSYGNNTSTTCSSVNSPDFHIDWDQNHLCNGDFEEMVIPNELKHKNFPSIPCWLGTSHFEIGYGFLY